LISLLPIKEDRPGWSYYRSRERRKRDEDGG